MTFAEQVPGLTRRFGRRAERLRSTPVSVGLALAGRADARMNVRAGAVFVNGRLVGRPGEVAA
ncbi:hypothetical protein OIU91_00185 [Streptomyces sp. NBC_01456]|nr:MULTISPECIES: hypothetical protein [unclassified Streptomyces]